MAWLFRPVICEEVNALLSSILKKARSSDNSLVIRDVLHNCSNNIISRMTIGKTLDEMRSIQQNGESIIELFCKVVECMGEINVSDIIPSLAWMDLQVRIDIFSKIECHDLRSQ